MRKTAAPRAGLLRTHAPVQLVDGQLGKPLEGKGSLATASPCALPWDLLWQLPWLCRDELVAGHLQARAHSSSATQHIKTSSY